MICKQCGDVSTSRLLKIYTLVVNYDGVLTMEEQLLAALEGYSKIGSRPRTIIVNSYFWDNLVKELKRNIPGYEEGKEDGLRVYRSKYGTVTVIRKSDISVYGDE